MAKNNRDHLEIKCNFYAKEMQISHKMSMLRVIGRSARRWKRIGERRRCGGIELAATPFMEWKLRRRDSADRSRGHRGGAVAAVSARKLAASLWQLAVTTNGGGSVRWRSGLFDRLGFEFCSSFPNPKFATEGVTKWDYHNSKAWDDIGYFQSNFKLTSIASTRQAELFKAKKRVNELKSERGWLRTKIKYCMKKLEEERGSWMRTEHHKICSIVKNLEDGVKRELKDRKKMDILNSKLLRDIAEAKLLARKFMHSHGKEKKARELFENMCSELAKEIEGYKAEIGALKSQRQKIQEEVEKERRMMQMSEVWREEQAQKKLVDAKLILENKFAEMNNLISDLKAFLSKSDSTTENVMSKAKVLRQSFDPVSIEGIKEFSCVVPKSDDIFTIEEDMCYNKSVCSNGSGMETVTEAEINSSRNLGENEFSVNKIRRSKCKSNRDTEQKFQKSESCEISSVSLNQSKKKGSSASKLQRTLPSNNKGTFKKILVDGNGRLSNRSRPSIVSLASSPKQVEVKIQRNPHVVRAMKGHIEWPRGIQRHGLAAANLLEDKLESQKTLLRSVLKQRR
ncbi:hypothetical protein DH2020_041791 [Rehmannia glutinosa]|uniref:Uncharacterized protein n=1 Tax=Rehmannia glutinosa TaxID=99300 RepID=A0ABR0UPS7_REHGL